MSTPAARSPLNVYEGISTDDLNQLLGTHAPVVIYDNSTALIPSSLYSNTAPPEFQYYQELVSPSGQPVSVELWSQPDQRFAGRIRELSPAADPKSRTFAARVAFTGGKVPAELGQSARVFIQADGVIPLSVPLSALSAENGASYVWRVQADNTLKRTPVRIGAFGEKTVPVLEGLAPTDWVIAAGVHVLHEGQQVRPVDRSNRVVNLAAKE